MPVMLLSYIVSSVAAAAAVEKVEALIKELADTLAFEESFVGPPLPGKAARLRIPVFKATFPKSP